MRRRRSQKKKQDQRQTTPPSAALVELRALLARGGVVVLAREADEALRALCAAEDTPLAVMDAEVADRIGLGRLGLVTFCADGVVVSSCPSSAADAAREELRWAKALVGEARGMSEQWRGEPPQDVKAGLAGTYRCGNEHTLELQRDGKAREEYCQSGFNGVQSTTLTGHWQHARDGYAIEILWLNEDSFLDVSWDHSSDARDIARQETLLVAWSHGKAVELRAGELPRLTPDPWGTWRRAD